MFNFTINPSFEQGALIYMHIIVLLSLLASLFAFNLLLTKTPRKSGSFKWYLLHVQIWQFVNDIHIGVLFIPLPLVPMVAAYCRGVFCLIGVPTYISFALMVLTLIAVRFAITLCFLYRHQAVAQSVQQYILGSLIQRCVIAAFVVALIGVFLCALWSGQDTFTGLDYLEQEEPAMMWISKKPFAYFVYDRRISPSRVLIALAVILTFTSSLVCLCFGLALHTLWMLRRQARLMSEATRVYHEKLLSALLTQFAVPFTTVSLPAMVAAYSVYTQTLTYQVSFIDYCILMTHSVVHSSVLVYTTPAYRRSVARSLRRAFRLPSPSADMAKRRQFSLPGSQVSNTNMQTRLS